MGDKTKELANAVKDWWEQHKYDVTGEYGDWNIFDEEPEFVTKAKEILGAWEKLPATSNDQGKRRLEAVRLSNWLELGFDGKNQPPIGIAGSCCPVDSSCSRRSS